MTRSRWGIRSNRARASSMPRARPIEESISLHERMSDGSGQGEVAPLEIAMSRCVAFRGGGDGDDIERSNTSEGFRRRR